MARQHVISLAISTALALVNFGPGLQAAVISAGVPYPVVNGGTAPGSPFDFDFFGGGKPSVLTNFAVSTLGSGLYVGNAEYTTLIAPDGTGPFVTGIAYDLTGDLDPSPHTALVATFSPFASGDFTVFILDANTDTQFVGNVTVGLGVNGGASVVTTTVLGGLNQFTRYDVTGALATDVFEVYATTGGGNDQSANGGRFPSIGGLAFTVAPEPASLALSMLGLGCLSLLAYRCRA